MFELVYPSGLEVPVLGTLKTVRHGAEMLPVVEPSGLVVGKAPRVSCHCPDMPAEQRPLHPVVHLHLIDRFGRIALQKRAETKDLYPGLWDTAVGGHVDFGESLQEALFREASEEIGLQGFTPYPLGVAVFESDRERELVSSFAAIRSDLPEFHSDEVTDLRFWTQEEVDHAMGSGLLTPTFEWEYRRIRQSLFALL